MTTPFWLNEPSILLHRDNIFNIWPSKNMDKNEKLNSITRMIIVLTLLGFFITNQFITCPSLQICTGVGAEQTETLRPEGRRLTLEEFQ